MQHTHDGLFLAACLLLVAACSAASAQNPEYPDFYTGENGRRAKGDDFVDSIRVNQPAYRADIRGDVKVVFKAPGMKQARALCWQQPTDADPNAWGHDALVMADTPLDAEGNGSFTFHADQFPNGPLTIRIHARNETKQDICELQLYNLGGVVWNQGIPKTDPVGAKNMTLAFADDFDGPLSISPDGYNARYAAHKTGGGDFSGWQFSDPAGENKPFGQVGTFLRIRASKEPGSKGRSGILSSIRADGTGVTAVMPCYFECRFIAQSAPGTWPAFWTLTKGPIGLGKSDPRYADLAKLGTDELDIIEAYGGYGPKNPNGGGLYHSVTHFWGKSYPKPDWYEKKNPDGQDNPLYQPHSFRTDSLTLGGKSSWSWTFHTYGMAVTETDTIYYFDDIEIGRHPTGALSKTQPHWFLVNYAIGGISGWQIDMERYANATDMYVDYIRVYAAEKP